MKDFNHYVKYEMKSLHSQRWSKYQAWCLIFVATLLDGCAPTLYSVDMKYIPRQGFPKTQELSQTIEVAVADFRDLRKTADNIVIGRVIKSNGEEIRVLPKFVKPSQAVTEPIRNLLRQAGYRVAMESPSWDLQESGINRDWGTILVGGSIDDLDILCQNSLTITKYSAKVKLTIYFANTVKGKIFHTLTTESSASLDHVIFSEEKMEQQLNTVLSSAIAKLFEGRGMISIISEAIKENP